MLEAFLIYMERRKNGETPLEQSLSLFLFVHFPNQHVTQTVKEFRSVYFPAFKF